MRSAGAAVRPPRAWACTTRYGRPIGRELLPVLDPHLVPRRAPGPPAHGPITRMVRFGVTRCRPLTTCQGRGTVEWLCAPPTRVRVRSPDQPPSESAPGDHRRCPSPGSGDQPPGGCTACLKATAGDWDSVGDLSSTSGSPLVLRLESSSVVPSLGPGSMAPPFKMTALLGLLPYGALVPSPPAERAKCR